MLVIAYDKVEEQSIVLSNNVCIAHLVTHVLLTALNVFAAFICFFVSFFGG